MEFEHSLATILDNMNKYLGYKLLPAADRDNDPERRLPTEKAPHRSSDKVKMVSMLGVVVAVLVLVSLGLRFIIAESSPHSGFLTHCGSTPGEALSNNCKFDILSFSWMPPACHDAELCDNFRMVREWEWFLDENMTQAVEQSEVDKGTYEKVYTSREYEEMQCVFSWRKMHRAVLKGTPIDGFSGDKGYSEYCGALLVERVEKPTEDSMHADNRERQAFLTELKFPHCGVGNFEAEERNEKT
jgi:hypothetical protein